jgi:hypothetical protein
MLRIIPLASLKKKPRKGLYAEAINASLGVRSAL